MYDITTECLAVQDGILYAAGRELNVLFEISLKDGRCTVLTDMPGEDCYQERLYNGVCVEDDILTLIPFNAQNVWLYNLSMKNWTKIDIGAYVDCRLNGKFVGGILKNKKLLLYGYKYSGILEIDVDTQSVNKYPNSDACFKKKFWNQTYAMVGNKIYLTPLVEDEVLSFDILSGESEKTYLGNISNVDENSNCGITFDGDYFYIMKHHGNVIYKWLPGNEALEPIQIDNFYNSKIPYFNGIVSIGKKLVLYSPKGKTYVYDTQNPEKSVIWEEKILYASYVPEYGLFVCKKGVIELYDESLNKISSYSTTVTADEHDNCIQNIELGYRILKERNMIEVQDFISIILKQEKEDVIIH